PLNYGAGAKWNVSLHEPATIGWRARYPSRRYLLLRRDLVRPGNEQAAVLFGQHRSADPRAQCTVDDGAAERFEYRAGVSSTDLGRRCRRLFGKGSDAAAAIGC